MKEGCMKVAVMGAGALGGYFGGRLAASGHAVTLIARGAHLAAIRERGLKILSPLGDLYLPEIAATDDPAGVGPVDLVLFMVKNYDVATAGRAILPMLGPETMVVTCQNGVSAHERLEAVVGPGRVLPGVARIPGEVPEPGVIRHTAPLDILIFGEPGGGASRRCAALAAALEGAGTTPKVSDHILHDLWSKMIAQAMLASITALCRCDLGPLRENPASRRLMGDAMAEAEAVGRAAVPDLPDGLIEANWAFLDGLPRTMHASMLDDLNAGKRLEVDYLSGDVVRIGREHGVATPIHEVFWAALQPFKDGAPA
jgi:2-dehydropantoate 2-reductase